MHRQTRQQPKVKETPAGNLDKEMMEIDGGAAQFDEAESTESENNGLA